MTNFKILNMGKLLLTLGCLFGSLNAINAQNSFVPLGMSSSQGKPAIFVLAPEGSSATGWTEVAKWKQIATDMQCKVVIIDGNTNSTSTSLTWSVSSDITGLTSIFNNETSSGIEGASRYMVSYGTNAGKVLAQYAKSNTNNLAGIAIINADLSTYTMTPDTSTLAVPLMLVNSPQSASNSVADFFKIRNATNQSKTVTNGTTFYNNNVTAHNGNLEYTHYVRIATGVADASIPNLLRDDLLTRVARWKTLEGDFTLRTKMVNNPNLFKIQETNASGSSSREAWVYIPSKVLEGTITGAVPMVLMFHGLTMNGKYFMDSTGWQDLAVPAGRRTVPV